MRNSFILTLFIIGLALQVRAQQAFDVEQAIQELANDKGNTGISAGYSVNGVTKWSNAAGYACLEDKSAFSTTTLTRIASISKNFT